MCGICGCATDMHDHDHEHEHDHEHPHVHDVEVALFAKNDRIAARNRDYFRAGRIRALNLVSSPGSGKTTLLERTISDLELKIQVIEGDQATSQDADRIRASGAEAYQVNTGAGCHLDASMIAHAVEHLRPSKASLLFIENVGNLVCPALFDLGEESKVLVASVTEGEDKPLKYPHMFRAARIALLNKVDLLPHLRFDIDRFLAHSRQVNPALQILPVSALTGEGLDRWYSWLRQSDVHS